MSSRMICSCPGVEGRDLSVRRDGRALHSSRYATVRSGRWKTDVPATNRPAPPRAGRRRPRPTPPSTSIRTASSGPNRSRRDDARSSVGDRGSVTVAKADKRQTRAVPCPDTGPALLPVTSISIPSTRVSERANGRSRWLVRRVMERAASAKKFRSACPGRRARRERKKMTHRRTPRLMFAKNVPNN